MFDSLNPVNNFSVMSRQVFWGWTSTKQRITVLFKDTTQWLHWQWQTQIRKLLKKQFDQGLLRLLFWHAICEFQPWQPVFYSVQNFRTETCYNKLVNSPYSANNFSSWKCCLLCTSAAYIKMHFRLHLIMEANTMNPDQIAPIEANIMEPDQTAPLGAVWSGFIEFAILAPKYCKTYNTLWIFLFGAIGGKIKNRQKYKWRNTVHSWQSLVCWYPYHQKSTFECWSMFQCRKKHILKGATIKSNSL